MPYLVIKLCQIIKSINKGLCFNPLFCLISSLKDSARVLRIGFWSESNGKNYLLHLIINYIVWLHFVCWLKENITFIILERYLTPVIERVWSDGYIIFNPMYQNQNIRSLNLSHWKSLARNPTDILRWWSILMFAARPDSDAAQSESMEISVLSLGLHHSGWYHYGPDSWVFREFD